MLSDVPIFHVLTRKKNVSVYAKVFGMVKQELQTLGVDTTTSRIILDFEKTGLAGIKRHFPMECQEGCSFHLSQAWNRRALSLGIKGDMKDIRVRKWWMTIKGLVFLPPHLHGKVPAFHRPSLPRSHHSYLKCEKFLAYLHKTWYNGRFKGIWNKWDKKELRASNVAETYHKLLRLLMREKRSGSEDYRMPQRIRQPGHVHPPLEKGIYRILRKKDVERRNKIDQCMELYRQPLHQRPVSIRVISTFCRKMARFTSSKVI